MLNNMPRVTLGPLSIEPPDKWTLTTFILAGPLEDEAPRSSLLGGKRPKPFQRNLVATIEQLTRDETPTAYVERQIQGPKQAAVSREEAARKDVSLDGGLTGLLTEQVISSPDGDVVRQMQLVCISEGLAYTLVTTHADGQRFEMARTEFLKMLLSLRVGGPP
jgi:hypothetical protein